jgi:hypothetical protein
MKESPEEVLELLLFDDDAGLATYLVGLRANLCHWHMVYNYDMKRKSLLNILIVEYYNY